MQVHQKLSILFYRKRKKQDKQGYIPIYCRITIDGVEDEISTSIKVLENQWDDERKEVRYLHPSYKKFNKTLSQIKIDLERHFDLVVAKNGIARPEDVFYSYRAPATAVQQKNENRENIDFSLDLDQFIKHMSNTTGR